MGNHRKNPAATASHRPRSRPISPNIQIYRPQLTSVLSIVNRITGVLLCAGAVGLVGWLVSAAEGPGVFAVMQNALASWVGQAMLLGCTFAFFLHLCGGIRHLFWDTARGLDLRTIYASGWWVMAVSIGLTAASWFASAWLGT